MRRVKGWFCCPISIQKLWCRYQGTIKQNTNCKYVLSFLDGLIPKLHNSPTNTIPLWKRECLQVPAILHHWNEFWFLYFIKWLVTSDYPFNKESLKLDLIPRRLEPLDLIFICNQKNRKPTTAAAFCFVKASLILAVCSSSLSMYRACAAESNSFWPDAYIISSAVGGWVPRDFITK